MSNISNFSQHSSKILPFPMSEIEIDPDTIKNRNKCPDSGVPYEDKCALAEDIAKGNVLVEDIQLTRKDTGARIMKVLCPYFSSEHLDCTLNRSCILNVLEGKKDGVGSIEITVDEKY